MAAVFQCLPPQTLKPLIKVPHYPGRLRQAQIWQLFPFFHNSSKQEFTFVSKSLPLVVTGFIAASSSLEWRAVRSYPIGEKMRRCIWIPSWPLCPSAEAPSFQPYCSTPYFLLILWENAQPTDCVSRLCYVLLKVRDSWLSSLAAKTWKSSASILTLDRVKWRFKMSSLRHVMYHAQFYLRSYLKQYFVVLVLLKTWRSFWISFWRSWAEANLTSDSIC